MHEEDNEGTAPRERRIMALKANLQRILTRRNQVILYVAAIILAALSIADVICDLFPLPVSVAVYVCAGVSFFLSIALWVRTIRLLIQVVLIPFTQRNPLIRIFFKDYKLRTVIMSLPGLGLNLIFALYNAYLGVTRLSPWYGSLAAYYILLCIMRFIAVMYAKSIYIDKREMTGRQRELKVYQGCGIMLSVMSIALMGAVIMLVNGVGGKSYPGLMIYVMSAYTFYKLTLSVLNMLRARREKSILSMTLRYIGHSESLVALLTLQTALFAAFGQSAGALVPRMNAATGGVVCLGALVIGLFMVFDARKRMRMNTDLKGEHRHG